MKRNDFILRNIIASSLNGDKFDEMMYGGEIQVFGDIPTECETYQLSSLI